MREGPKPGPRDTRFFDDPLTDDLLRALATLAMELSVTRDRLAALERHLQAAHGLDAGALDALPPDPAADATQAAARMQLVKDVFGPLVERLAKS
jgi:hypothetical protein